MTDLLYKEETYQIIGACFDVYNEMGCGFLESVYHECLEIEFSRRKIPFSSHKKLKLAFRGKPLKKDFEADFLCFDKIVVEIKATAAIISEYEAQTINYLNATKFKLGLLVNFGHYPKLEYKRIILDKMKRK